MSIDYNQLRDFLLAIAQTEITELNLKSQDFELNIRKNPAIVTDVVHTPTIPVTNINTSPVTPKPVTTPTTTVTPEAPAPSPVEKKWLEITSPMVGTFYRAPAPDEAPFVEVNERIRTGQVVCIIEAMKLMNEIESEVSGQIMEIAVTNGQPVEFGQTLMWVKPD